MKKGTALLLLLLTAAIGYIVLDTMNISAISDMKEALTSEKELYTDPYEITTNTNIKQGSSYIRASIVLSTTNKDTLETLNTATAPVREILVRYINTHEASAWTDTKKRETTKTEIKKKVEKQLSVTIKDVYITNIVKQ